jgi:hypothetical protein
MSASKIRHKGVQILTQWCIMGKNGKYARCSSWRDNTGKIIDFYTLIHYQSIKVQGCPENAYNGLFLLTGKK